MPIWVDGCCVIKSPIAESEALSREPGNTGWTVYTRVLIKPYLEDLYNNQFQPNQTDDVADDAVARVGAEKRANHGNDNIVHTMNNRAWTLEQKRKLFEIDRQERRRGNNFVKRLKA